jgi:hypothetical protein
MRQSGFTFLFLTAFNLALGQSSQQLAFESPGGETLRARLQPFHWHL